MTKKFRRIILNLFDGSGAGAAADGAAGSGDGETTSSVDIKPEVKARGRELGVDDDLMESYQKAFFGNKNTGDSGNEGNDGQTDTKETEQQESENLDAEFDKLVKGKYKDAFTKRQSAAIKDRLGNVNRSKAELEGKLSDFQRFADLMGEKYGTNDPKALYDAIRNDKELWRQQAIDKGQTSEEFIESYDSKLNEQAQQRELEELRQYKAANELNARLRNLAQETAKLYPDFDLEAEFENPRFTQALDVIAAQREAQNKRNGTNDEVFDITYAYELAHADEIRSNTIKRASKAAMNAMAQTIQANRQRPAENMARRAAPNQQKSYRDMTDEEFDAYLDKVKRGEAKI